jgi:hypothetical protein
MAIAAFNCPKQITEDREQRKEGQKKSAFPKFATSIRYPAVEPLKVPSLPAFKLSSLYPVFFLTQSTNQLNKLVYK